MEFHASTILKSNAKDIKIWTFGGHLTEFPMGNCLTNVMRIYHYGIDKKGNLVKYDIMAFKCPEHQLKTEDKRWWRGSHIPPLTMSSATNIKDCVWIYGGFNSDYDRAQDNLYKITNADTKPLCTLIGGPTMVQETGWTSDELSKNKCLIQKGAFPRERMGHQMTSNKHFLGNCTKL